MNDMPKIINFLNQLELNNNREWYHEHKKEREEATLLFEGLVQEFIDRICELDERVLQYQPKELTFKLVRDTRFSKDKSPYNPSFRAHISSRGKQPIPVGFYLHITTQGNSFLGGGLFIDGLSEATARVRDYMIHHEAEWNQIVQAEDFKEYFEVMGTKLKNIPKGYDNDCSISEYLKHKSWYLEYPVPERDLFDKDFVDKAVEVFMRMVPFHHYLNDALKDFKMPAR